MYAKVFAQILESTLAEDWMMRHVFMDFLVLADKDGIVDMTIPGIARRTNAPVELIEKAVAYLSAPDPNSRNHDEDGRRIVPFDVSRGWGWRVVNYVNYCKLRDEPTRKQYMRGYMQERRKRLREGKQASQPVESTESRFTVNSVNPVNLTLANVPVPVSKELNTLSSPVPTEKKATRIPDDFQVTDRHREFAKKNNFKPPETEIEHFRDHFQAKAGPNSRKLDWDLTFFNWMRNNQAFNRNLGPTTRPKMSPTRYAQGNLL